MSVGPFFDTNILLYSISDDRGEAEKRGRAIALLQARDAALSVQVLQEFYVQATRSMRPDPLPHDLAVRLMRSWMRFRVQETTVEVMLGALEITAAHRLSYWDAAIVSAARALGCRELLSEDMAHGRQIDGVRIVDPFR